MSLNLLALQQQNNEQNQTTTSTSSPPSLNGSAGDLSSQAPSQASSTQQEQQLFYMTFNQLNTHAAFSTDRGFFIFNMLPSGVKVSSHKIFRKENSLSFFSEDDDETESVLGSFIGAPVPPSKPPQLNLAAALQNNSDAFDLFSWGGVGIIQFLNKTKFYGIVGGGPKPCFPTNRLVIWDDQSKSVAIDQFFAKPIRNLKLHSKIVVVVMEECVFILTHELKPHPHYISPLETTKNPRGIFALSADDDNVVLAIPGATKGSVRLEFITSGSKSATIATAHESEISCLAISKDGKKLATASEKGTLIRIWSTETLEMVKEVRRGSFRAEIHCIGFSDDNNYMCCYSSAKTLHLFNISNASAPGENRTSTFSLISYVVPVKFFTNEWSCVEYKGIEGPAICAFGSDNKTVRVLTAKGKLYELVFDLSKGGEPMNVVITDLLQEIHHLK